MKLFRSLAGPADAERLLREASIQVVDGQIVLAVGRAITDAECAALKELWERKYAAFPLADVLKQLRPETGP